MSEQDPWAEFRVTPTTEVASSNPWAVYTAPGTTPSTAVEPDKYRAAAVEERERLIKAGVPLPSGYTNRLGMGAGMGWLDEAMAAGSTPFEMAKRGTWSPREAYNYALARERLNNEKTRENTAGVLGGATELLGGAASVGGTIAGAGGHVASRVGIPFTAKTMPAWVATTGKNAGLGGVLGGVSGAGEAENIAGIPASMLSHGLIGAGIGGAAPWAIQGVGNALGAASRVLQTPRMFAPQNVADKRVLEIADAAGVKPAEIAERVRDAAAVGQPYSVADAIGNEGVRALTAQAKTPGAQREAIVEALVPRAMQRPQRVSEEVVTGFGAPGTALQATEALIDRAGRQSGPKYREAEQVPTWSPRLQQMLVDNPSDVRSAMAHGIRMQRREASARGEPLGGVGTDRVVTDFGDALENISTNVPNVRTLQVMKEGLDHMIEQAINPRTGRLNKEGSSLVTLKNAILAEMDHLNPAYGEARRLYADPMRIKDAVSEGQGMVTRGRAADNIARFAELSAPEQQGLRIGYADKMLDPLERTGNMPTIMRAKSPKGMAETDAFQLYQGPLRPGEPNQFRKFMNREEAMQRAETKALGGSQTAENLADMAAADKSAAEAVGAVNDLMTANAPGLAMRGWNVAAKYARGNSEAQRMAITRALLETSPDAAQAMAARLAKRQADVDYLRDVAMKRAQTRPFWARRLTNGP